MSVRRRAPQAQDRNPERTLADLHVVVVYRSVTDLRPNARNANRHPPKQVRQLAGSIETFGFNVPILVDGSLQVIAGHGRLLAARHLGLREVPTIMIDHLSEAQVRAFMIADNQLNKLSSWDEQSSDRSRSSSRNSTWISASSSPASIWARSRC